MTFAHSIGWTLVHSIWEIAAVGVLLFSVNLCVSRSNAKLRYGLALGSIILCLAIPLATLVSLTPKPSFAKSKVGVLNASTKSESHLTPVPLNSYPQLLPAAEPSGLNERVEALLPRAVLFWLIGMGCMCIRMIGGLAMIARIKKRASAASDPRWQAMLSLLACRLGLRGTILLMASDRIETPMALGLLKSAIVFPASVLLKLPPSDLEALMAHELAHIRRYDALVNFCQSIVETALFYHPAVWWISSVVRSEREHCCDDLAISAIGNREQYANALLGLEQLRHPLTGLAMAATRGSLVSRIRRILLPSQRPILPTSVLATVAVTAAIAIGLTRTLDASSQKLPLSDPNKPLEISGQVIDDAGHPVSGATVFCHLRRRESHVFQETEATSDVSGHYKMTIPPFEMYVVTGYLSGVGVGWENYDRRGRRALRLHKTGSLRLKVVDIVGKPIGRLRIGPSSCILDNRFGSMPPNLYEKFSGVTNSSGMTQVEGVPLDGETGFDAKDERFAEPMNVSAYPKGGGTVQVVLKPACRISGTVTLNGKPVEGATVIARGRGHTAVSNRQGHFELKRENKGTTSLTCLLPMALREQWVTSNLEVATTPDHSGFAEFKLEPGAEIIGKVLDSSGHPAERVQVSISSSTDSSSYYWNAMTGQDGSFKTRVPAGTHSIQLFDRWQKSATKVTTKEGETKTLTFVRPGKEDAVDIECTVLDADGKPSSHANIEYGFPGSDSLAPVLAAQTDRRGEESIHPLKSQMKGLWIKASTDKQESDRLRNVQGDHITVRMHRIRPASVVGYVRDSNGKVMPDVDVVIMRFFAPQKAMTTEYHRTDSNGKYLFTGVYKQGTYVVMAQTSHHADTISQKFVVNPSGQRILGPAISMPPGHAIKGRIVDQLGKPVPHAQVLAINDNMPFGSQCYSEKDGTFAIYRLASGQYSLAISRDGKKAQATASTDTIGNYRLNL